MPRKYLFVIGVDNIQSNMPIIVVQKKSRSRSRIKTQELDKMAAPFVSFRFRLIRIFG